MKFSRRVQPFKVLPPDLIHGFYAKDPNKLKEIEDWLGKNGLTILFTLGEAYGDETVYLGSDQKIYIGTEKLPKKAWLKKCLLRHSSELLQKAVKERWTRHEIFRELKKLSEMV